MKTKVYSNKTHGRFWSLIKQLPGYNPGYKEEIKEGLCLKYSCDRTASLSELYKKYPRDYERMIYDLKIDTFQSAQHRRLYDRESDLWRKRAIAVVCKWIDRQGIKMHSRQKIQYAISIITRAANCKDFNKIPVSRLAEIYNYFLKRNNINTPAAEAALLEFEAEQFLQEIKNKHFKNKNYESK